MEKVQDIRKSSLTFAPEAGSQRMRDVINKGITEEDILSVIEQADDYDIHYFHPTDAEMGVFYSVYERLTREMSQKYLKDAENIMAYNRRKVENWIEIQTEQLNLQIAEAS